MCGIFAILSEKALGPGVRELAYQQSLLQRHRGPEETGVVMTEKGVIIQERLALVGLETGRQPLISKGDNLVLAANCEIYNYKEIEKIIGEPYKARSDSDVILAMYEQYGKGMIDHIKGMYAFLIYDKKTENVFIARDPIGIIPLYYGYDEEKRLWLASEMKCLVNKCQTIEIFEPGSYMLGKVSSLSKTRYYIPQWTKRVPTTPVDLGMLSAKLIKEVKSHLPMEVRVGAFLSGGLDSSLIAGIASKLLKSGEHKSECDAKLSTYSIGMKDSPDLGHARIVADYIGSDHHEIIFTAEEGIDCIREVVWHLDSYDVTTVRASIPMYMLSRKVRKDGIKVVLSGEGADELFGGYLYFHQAPNATDFHWETAARVLNLSYSDCLRANKSTLAWGVELRVPMLATEFINHVMEIRPEDRMTPSAADTEKRRCEKYILRKAFSGQGIIPESVIWRQKEQFSDGVGYGWIDALRSNAESRVSDEEFAQAAVLFPYNTPDTKEAFYIRKIYQEQFGTIGDRTVMKWTPRTDWGCSSDPSGRTQKVHLAHVLQ